MCFVFIWEQTATCATYSINWLVFITEMKSVYCAVRTGFLNKAVCASSLNMLQRRASKHGITNLNIPSVQVSEFNNVKAIHLATKVLGRFRTAMENTAKVDRGSTTRILNCSWPRPDSLWDPSNKCFLFSKWTKYSNPRLSCLKVLHRVLISNVLLERGILNFWNTEGMIPGWNVLNAARPSHYYRLV